MNKTNQNFQILIVDDNKELREILQEYLKDDGSLVMGADNGKQALEKHLKTPFDLIITDLMMPEITGMELIRAIRAQSEMTEFVIITGYASLDSAVEAIKIGAFDYIVKPFRMEELKVVVKNVRDKITLKKVNQELFNKLEGFYNEMERYGQNASQNAPRNGEDRSISNTETVIGDIKKLDNLRKSRFMID
jgi:DNA-binding NtrC family response regulator